MKLKLPKFKKDDESKYIVSLDIGTEFVKALIGEVVSKTSEKTGKSEQYIEIIGAGRKRQRLTDRFAELEAQESEAEEECDSEESVDGSEGCDCDGECDEDCECYDDCD